MLAASLVALVAAPALASASASSSPYFHPNALYALKDNIIQVSGAENQYFNVTPIQNQTQVASAITAQLGVGSNVTSQITSQTKTIQNVTSLFNISTHVWTPKKKWSGAVQILVHGIGADHRYWIDSNRNQSYVQAALDAGHAVVAYDRLGTGASSHPDGVKVVQAATDLVILKNFVAWTKSYPAFRNATTFIGVGHSYGSFQLAGLASKYPTLLNKIILTGFSTTASFQPSFMFALQPTIASQLNYTDFKKYSNDSTYWASSGVTSDQFSFFYPGGYSQQTLVEFEATKQPYTQGVGLTIGSLGAMLPATNYTGEVLVVTGHQDLPFCGGNCYQAPVPAPPAPFSNVTNLIAAVQPAFFAASRFSTYIPDMTGHAVNKHFSAPTTYGIINSWLNGTY